jgi:hypothetical protein
MSYICPHCQQALKSRDEILSGYHKVCIEAINIAMFYGAMMTAKEIIDAGYPSPLAIACRRLNLPYDKTSENSFLEKLPDTVIPENFWKYVFHALKRSLA